MPDTSPIYYVPEVPEPNKVTAALTTHAQRVIGELAARLGGTPPGPGGGPVPLFIFDSEWALNNHMSETVGAGGSGGASGVFYHPAPDRLGIAMYTRGIPVLDLMTTVQHECFHHAAYRAFGGCLPRWIDEGLAQYFQDALWFEHGMVGGMANPDRLEKLRDPGYPRLRVAELLETPDSLWFESPAQSRVEVSRLYESSWLVVFALIAGPDQALRQAFAKYLGVLRTPGVDHARAWSLTLGQVPTERLDDAAEQVLADCSPPGVCEAVNKLTVLAMVLSLLNQHNQRMPSSIEETGRRMRMLGIDLYRRIPGSEPIRYRGDDPRLYSYEIEDGLTTEFELTPAVERMQPPVLSAPGVLGDPRVRWVGKGRRWVPWIEFDPQALPR